MMAAVLMLIFIKFIYNRHINHNIFLLLVIPFLFYACETATYKNDLYTNKIIGEIEKTSLNDNKEIIKDLKIGMLLPLSGEKSKVGKSLLRASQLSLNKTNNKNIKLFVQDTEDPYKNIISSYYELIDEDVDIILGPLFSQNIKLIAPIALDHKTIMITFSNNTEIKNKNIFISGLTPENEITEVLKYAISKGKNKFGVILPDNRYGLRSKKLIENILLDNKSQISKIVLYDPKNPDFYQVAKEVANYEKRKFELEKKLQELKSAKTVESEKLYKILKNQDTLGSLDFDSLYIGAENVKHLSMLASILPYYDVDPKEVLYIGNSLWSHNIALKEPALEKGIFSNIDQINYENFANDYYKTFNEKPNKISSIAYDLIGLVSSFQKNNQEISFDNMTSENGFVGTNGLFRFKKDGDIERLLPIFQIKNQQIKMVKKANLDFK